MVFQPIDGVEGKIATAQVHEYLRQLILDGTVPPGTVLSQVQLAQEIGVSRTPLREALRMLQEEGLVLAEYNHRVRVADIDIGEFEQFYASRIMLESLALALTLPHLTPGDFDKMAALLDQMHIAGERRDHEHWDEGNRQFHAILSSYTGGQMREIILRSIEAGERYRRIKFQNLAHAWEVAEVEHKAIFEACRAGNRDAAVELLARHLARTALTVIALADLEYEPVAVRAALRLVTGKGGK
ncbi:MAG TPA: GntR family transcriptional regulator [Ktedonobacteraceae bacterium]|nr:GntR family transcriptional regulator [Ktedonobacteraceae bacterium]